MAEPGDPQTSDDHASHAHDDLIGFTSPSSLAGVGRAPSVPAVVPAPMAAALESDPGEAYDRDLFDDPAPGWPAEDTPRRTQAIPEWARETRSAAPPSAYPTAPRFDRPTPPEGATGLYAIYALILFAVPTIGVSAVVALLAVTLRQTPVEPLALGHFLFQKRTLWITGIGAAIGVVLIAVNLGVFVLFLMAVWVIVRGTWGVLRLVSGKPITDPETWLI